MDQDYINKICSRIIDRSKIEREVYARFDVKRGLPNSEVRCVSRVEQDIQCAGLRKYVDGKIQPIDGRLIYRGIDMQDIVEGVQRDSRHGYAETAYLVLFGNLPKKVS